MNSIIVTKLHGNKVREHGDPILDLRCSDLRNFNFSPYVGDSYYNLSCVDLSASDLSGADLRGCFLEHTKLTGVNFSGAKLQGACLAGTDLKGANFSGADMTDVDLYDANLTGAILPDGHQLCPPVGIEFPGWKKRRDGAILKLLIPSTAERCNGIGSRKCRASEARVVQVIGGDKISGGNYFCGINYVCDSIVYPDSYDGDIRRIYTHGVHFYLGAEEDINWR